MTEPLQNTGPLSLWECLHDGSIVSFASDLMSRTLTVTVDSPYHWEFHNLPADTRFQIVGENVRIAEAFDFEPWLGAIEPPRETPWEETQAQRQENYEKGRLISTDWNVFVADVETDEDYEIMNAELSMDQPLAVLELGIMSYPNSNYRTIKIHAKRFEFHVGERQLSIEDFLQFGAAYWQNFGGKSRAASVDTELSVAAKPEGPNV
jgi:hypothetical protein